jgi:hypothetical protein
MKFKIISLTLTVLLILVLVPIAFAGNVDDGETNAFCADLNGRQHPVGGRIASVYEVNYQGLMSWFCDGNYGFGEILLALQTSKITGADPGALLVRKTEVGGWGEVWKELGFTGRPKEGRPAWAGPKVSDGEGRLVGPPPWAGPKGMGDVEGEEGDGGPPPWAGPKNKIKPWKDTP